jgi:hypothetical protein
VRTKRFGWETSWATIVSLDTELGIEPWLSIMSFFVIVIIGVIIVTTTTTTTT